MEPLFLNKNHPEFGEALVVTEETHGMSVRLQIDGTVAEFSNIPLESWFNMVTNSGGNMRKLEVEVLEQILDEVTNSKPEYSHFIGRAQTMLRRSKAGQEWEKPGYSHFNFDRQEPKKSSAKVTLALRGLEKVVESLRVLGSAMEELGKALHELNDKNSE